LITTFSGFIKAREKEEQRGSEGENREKTEGRNRGGKEHWKQEHNGGADEKRPGTEEDFEHRRRMEGGRTRRKLRGRTGGN
jgi:hypothetical protein